MLKGETIAVVGLGLMGGSLALALKANTGTHVVGVDPDPRARTLAIKMRAVDETTADLEEAAGRADIVVLAAPVRTILELIPVVGRAARAGTCILDVGSTKAQIVAAMDRLPEHVAAVGGHPMCGKETRGIEGAEAGLFRKAAFVLCPSGRSTGAALEQARALVAAAGARAIEMEAARHDRIAAMTSHLPFVIASTLMATAGKSVESEPALFSLAASGFRDTSRLAASDEQMMLDILLTNSENVADKMRQFSILFAELADLVYEENGPELARRLGAAAAARRGYQAGAADD